LRFVLTLAVHGQESRHFEKGRDLSHDEKFAVRALRSSSRPDLEDVDPNLIMGADLVSMPTKIGRPQIT
jgi:hypothetical protein